MSTRKTLPSSAANKPIALSLDATVSMVVPVTVCTCVCVCVCVLLWFYFFVVALHVIITVFDFFVFCSKVVRMKSSSISLRG